MNLWEQYNPERSLGELLGEATGLPLWQCADKALFEALKRHLTRRELRCLVMEEGGATREQIAEETGFTVEEVVQAVHKGRKKLRQPKLRQEFQSLIAGMDENEALE